MAEKMGRSPATIGRELARNSSARGYEADTAQRRYEERRRACRPGRKMGRQPLGDYVVKNIRDEEWTPEQVAGRLPLDYPDDPTMRISHETIYQEIYRRHDLHYLVTCLPQSRPKRRKRGQGKTRRGPSIPNRISIKQRPAQVEERQEAGHWEGDTIVGKNQDGYIITLVERVSRMLHAVKIHTKNAGPVARAIIEQLLDRPVSWIKTITFDNGTEFAAHELISQELPLDVYFADPYSSYQRGTNENTNGLIRRYLPKGRSFKELTQCRLDAIVNQLNNRPRKCLRFKTPNEVFNEHRQQRLFALGA